MNDGDSASIELRKVEIDVIPLGVCKNLELYKHISKGSFCAGALAGGRDSCQVRHWMHVDYEWTAFG